MIASDSELQGKEIYSQAKDIEKALECESLQKMIRGSVGAFTFRYWFINEYINSFNLIGSKPNIKSNYNDLKKRKIPVDLLNISNSIMELWKIIASNKKHNPVDLVFISRNRKARIKTRSGYIEGDYIFYRVIDELKKRHPDLDIAIYLIDDTVLKYEYATTQDILKSVYCALEKSLLWTFRKKDLLNYFEKHGYDNEGLFARTFFRFRPLLRNALLGYSIKSMLAAYNPSVIVSNDDCLYTRPLINRDLKMIVLQSASIVKAIEDCRALIFQDSRLQPNLFLCSGKESAEIKAKAGAARKVVATGQPRYDILFNLQELYCKEDFKKRYGIEPKQKIVLWATQTHGLSNEENLKNLQAVMGAFQGQGDVTLVIKQHPAETEVHTKLIKEVLDRYHVNAVLTPKDSDTYEQLFACDLMITKHSTTALEAVAMRKPVIILNLSNKHDLIDYVSEKVAVGVYKEKDIRLTIERLLNNDRELEENRDAYLDRHLFMIDGKATERVVDAIVQMIGSKES